MAREERNAELPGGEPEQDELGAALDALNVEITEVEDWLEAQGFRTRAQVALPSGGHLAWGKRGQEYMLLVCHPPETTREYALTSVPSVRRLEAVDYLPALAAECRQRQNMVVADVRAAGGRLRALRGADLLPAERSRRSVMDEAGPLVARLERLASGASEPVRVHLALASQAVQRAATTALREGGPS